MPTATEHSEKINQFAAEERISQKVADALEVLNTEGFSIRFGIFKTENSIRKSFVQASGIFQQEIAVELDDEKTDLNQEDVIEEKTPQPNGQFPKDLFG